ncbi:uncharacterized protein BO80DRAFT_441623 [Aspergillus ibericus CBS 121593]|uniref:Uncharacterized protein n=1 Tax=Aspergillus ibericus CBS 121593 TaxID=1448316 RepID=A0A395HA98_9EURO|nr:hypothetical protein BO80DRAFT_441623 [Aspergillus ibericus CBS 121593]RAL04772.1 hypothetical protein BO80DRAFT_441623 [Aspergillus ibericus CBS 121593]
MSNSTTTTTETDTPSNIPPYTPMTSLGHELGVLFGFLTACFVVMAVYVYFWRAAETREEHAQSLRREMLLNRGIHHGRGGIHEKMMNQFSTTATATASSSHNPYIQQQPLPGNEIGVAVTTGMGTAMEIGSPSLGPARMINIHSRRGGKGPEGGVGVGGSGVGRGNDGGGMGMEMDADVDAEVGVEMDVLGFLQHGHGRGHGGAHGHGHGRSQQGFAQG